MALMAQELKSNLQPNIDTLMHCLETSTVWLYIARSAFTDVFLPCKAALEHYRACGLLGCTNQGWHGVKLLIMSISTHAVGYVHICHLLRGQHYCQCPNNRESPPSAWPPTPIAHPVPLPPTHPLYTTRVILQEL